MIDVPEERAVAKRIATHASNLEREALLLWIGGLLKIRDSSAVKITKIKHAITLTAKSDVVWPLAKLTAAELKRIGWDERGTKSRAALATAMATLALFGTQGAGIAALGTAIGVPLWIVLGAGAYFAAGLIEELLEKLPIEARIRMKAELAKMKRLPRSS